MKYVLIFFLSLGFCIRCVAADEEAIRSFIKAVHLDTPAKVTEMLNADPSLANAQRFRTLVLHEAIREKRKDIVMILLDHGAKVDGYEHPWGYPVHVASDYGDMDTLTELVKRGARVVVTNDGGCQPIHEAAKSGQTNIMSWLLRKGCSVDAYDRDEMTPLSLAALNGQIDAIEMLIQAGADVNHQSKKRMAPLHFAVIKGGTNVVRVLLTHGANVNLKNLDGQTPAALALRLDEIATAKFIREFKPLK